MLMVSFLLHFVQTSYIFNVILMNMLKQSKTNTIIHRKLNLRIFTNIILLFKIFSKLVFVTVSICGLNVLLLKGLWRGGNERLTDLIFGFLMSFYIWLQIFSFASLPVVEKIGH